MSDKINEVNSLHFNEYPEDIKITEWSGCNYYINQGNNEHEPVGTAQSMHDCIDCERISYCLVKQPTPTWEYSEEIKKQIDSNWLKMMN